MTFFFFFLNKGFILFFKISSTPSMKLKFTTPDQESQASPNELARCPDVMTFLESIFINLIGS